MKNYVGLTSLALLAFAIPQPALAAVDAQDRTFDQRIAGYHADLREMAARIKTDHPRPFRIITEADFDTLVAEEILTLDSKATRADFLWSMSRIIASIGCGHSMLPFFNQQNAEIAVHQRFPLEARFHNGRLFVMDPLTNAGKLRKGQEITAINGRPIGAIHAEIMSRIQADADIPHFKEPMANVYATSYLTYALGFPASYAVTLRGSTTPIALSPLDDYRPQPVISPLADCQEELCYAVDSASNLGTMTLRRMDYYGGDRADRFVEFIAEAFADLEGQSRDGLLIDTRGVLGGSGNAASYILRHLAKKPFAWFTDASDPEGSKSLFLMQQPIENGFAGEVFILMDGATVSTAPHMFAVAQANDIATLVGSPAGGGRSTNDGKKTYTSTHEGVEYSVARMIFDVAAPQLGMDEAVRPDILLPASLKDTLDRTDDMRARAIDILSARTGKRRSTG